MLRHMLRHPIRFPRDHHFTMVHAFDYLDGEVDGPALRRIDDHTGLCRTCREALRLLRGTLEGLRGLRSAPDPAIVPGVLDVLRRSGPPDPAGRDAWS